MTISYAARFSQSILYSFTSGDREGEELGTPRKLSFKVSSLITHVGSSFWSSFAYFVITRDARRARAAVGGSTRIHAPLVNSAVGSSRSARRSNTVLHSVWLDDQQTTTILFGSSSKKKKRCLTLLTGAKKNDREGKKEKRVRVLSLTVVPHATHAEKQKGERERHTHTPAREAVIAHAPPK